MRLIHHSLPDVGEREVREIARAIARHEVGYGGTVARFEERLARFHGIDHAVAVNSGSAALHLALLALGVGRGDRVIMPTYCCAAVMNAVRYTGADPRLVDIDPETFNIDPALARKAVTRRTRAIIVPHMFGLPADVKSLGRLGVPMIEDCSMSIGARIGQRTVGAFGDVAIMSFYATKVMTTGGGGALLTSNAAISRRVRDLVAYDNRDDYKVRYNYGMSMLNAAAGLSQLARLSSFLKRRREIAEHYYGSWESLPLKLPAGRGGGHIFYRYVIRTRGRADDLARRLELRGIESKRPVYRPLHRYFPALRDGFPAAAVVHREALSIPIYPAMSDSEVGNVINGLCEVCR